MTVQDSGLGVAMAEAGRLEYEKAWTEFAADDTHPFPARLRCASRARIGHFRNFKGERYHEQRDGMEWTRLQWCNAVLGELGEASNEVKRFDRGDCTLETLGAPLTSELADVLIYLDILALRFTLPPLSLMPRRPDPVEPAAPLFAVMVALHRAFQPFPTLALAQLHDLPVHDGQLLALRIAVDSMLRICSLIAKRVDHDMQWAVATKFNATSKRIGSKVYLAPPRARK